MIKYYQFLDNNLEDKILLLAVKDAHYIPNKDEIVIVNDQRFFVIDVWHIIDTHKSEHTVEILCLNEEQVRAISGQVQVQTNQAEPGDEEM